MLLICAMHPHPPSGHLLPKGEGKNQSQLSFVANQDRIWNKAVYGHFQPFGGSNAAQCGHIARVGVRCRQRSGGRPPAPSACWSSSARPTGWTTRAEVPLRLAQSRTALMASARHQEADSGANDGHHHGRRIHHDEVRYRLVHPRHGAHHALDRPPPQRLCRRDEGFDDMLYRERLHPPRPGVTPPFRHRELGEVHHDRPQDGASADTDQGVDEVILFPENECPGLLQPQLPGAGRLAAAVRLVPPPPAGPAGRTGRQRTVEDLAALATSGDIGGRVAGVRIHARNTGLSAPGLDRGCHGNGSRGHELP